MYLSEPNLTLGLTDHPLDKNASPVINVLSLVDIWLARTPISILKTELRTREKNAFIFEAYGYDIIHKRNFDVDYVKYFTDEKTKSTKCALQIDILTSTTYRFRLTMKEEVPTHDTPMVYSDITDETVKVTLEEFDEKYVISTPDLHLHVYRENFRVEIYDSDGVLITESGSKTHNEFFTATDSFPLGFIRNKKPKGLYAVENFNLYPGESIFGLGEKFGPLNRVGQTVSLWTIDGIGNTTNRAYKHIPFFLSSRGYGVFFNDYNPMTFWVGTREVSKVIMASESDIVDYYFFYGPSPKQVLQSYTDLTGKPSTLPRWSFGTWMSRLSYGSQEEVLDVARRLRKDKFPCDVIHIDTKWFTHEWACDWRFDEARFPDPAAMFRACADLGFKISLWQIPYVMNSLDVSKEGRAKGVFAKNHGPFIFLTLGPARVIDFSKTEGVDWYKEKLKPLFELGAKVMKVDFGEQIESHQEFAKYSGREMHNLYPLLYNKAAFEVTEETLGDGQAVIWARSAYAGSQRYPVHWSGDNSSNYSNMLPSIRGGLSLGLCGFTYWSQDVGGFVGIPDDKLYIRWTALCIFQSHIRFHGCAPKFREPWNYSPEAQDVVRKLLEYRYQLIPYLFSEGIKAGREGLPLMRPLLLEFPDDPTSYSIEDQFCSGTNLLVAPLFSEQDFRRVYLPPGEWYNFWTGESTNGPAWMQYEDVPLDQIPVFVKAGTLLPLGEIMQFVPEDPPMRLILCAYPNSDGIVEYTLHDEIGSIRFQGVMNADKIRIEISCFPEDRPVPEFECRLLPSHTSVEVEIIQKQR